MKFDELSKRKDEVKEAENKFKKIIKVECLKCIDWDIEDISITKFYHKDNLKIVFKNHMTLMYDSDGFMNGDKWAFDSNRNCLSESQLDKVAKVIEHLSKITDGEIEF